MRYVAWLTALALSSITPTDVVAQQTGGTAGSGKAQAKSVLAASDFDQAIEVIATSPDRDAVNAAAAKLRSGRLAAIRALVPHLTDSRRPPSDYLTRAVSGEVDMGDHSFWLIQDILESHTSKMDAQYSPLRKDGVAKWLADREGMSWVELRREACIGAFANILAMGKQYPDFDVRPVIVSYAARLVELDQAVRNERQASRSTGGRELRD
jgi:hypothetical protein